jgi:hypothetical protein
MINARQKLHLKLFIWIFLAFSLFYIGLTRGHFTDIMQVNLYQTTRSLCEGGNLTTSPIYDSHLGRYGKYYSQFGVAQSIAAIPLYAIGKAIHYYLTAWNKRDILSALAGPQLGEEPWRFGGDIEMFFVNLFNCFVTALLCSVFFIISLRLGATPLMSFIATLLLGLTSYVVPFSTGFLGHSSEALFVLLAFFFLFLFTKTNKTIHILFAGSALALAFLFRFPAAIALPGLSIYLFLHIWCSRPEGNTVIFIIKKIFPKFILFGFPLMVASLIHLTVTYFKFETLWKYNNPGFNLPLLKGLYAFLISPGNSIFLFTPMLLLTPWTFKFFHKRYRLESLCILFISATYLIFYGKYEMYHGLWAALGPRYLVPIVPLLLLSLALWIQMSGRKIWLIVLPLAVIGFWVQLVHIAVSFSYVYHYEGYLDFNPPYSFLFIPDVSPIVAHSKALLVADSRVDMWLVNVYRSFGIDAALVFIIPLIALITVSIWNIVRNLKKIENYEHGID